MRRSTSIGSKLLAPRLDKTVAFGRPLPVVALLTATRLDEFQVPNCLFLSIEGCKISNHFVNCINIEMFRFEPFSVNTSSSSLKFPA
jgi:hypothetical protein